MRSGTDGRVVIAASLEACERVQSAAADDRGTRIAYTTVWNADERALKSRLSALALEIAATDPGDPLAAHRRDPPHKPHGVPVAAGLECSAPAPCRSPSPAKRLPRNRRDNR